MPHAPEPTVFAVGLRSNAALASISCHSERAEGARGTCCSSSAPQFMWGQPPPAVRVAKRRRSADEGTADNARRRHQAPAPGGATDNSPGRESGVTAPKVEQV